MSKKKYMCKVCKRRFSTKKELKIHEKTHEKRINLEKILVLSSFIIVILISIFIYSRQSRPIEKGPKITIISPLNKTYYDEHILFNVTADIPMILKGNFGKRNVTLCDKCSAIIINMRPSAGTHRINIYGIDSQNRMYTDSLTFTVDIK